MDMLKDIKTTIESHSRDIGILSEKLEQSRAEAQLAVNLANARKERAALTVMRTYKLYVNLSHAWF